MTERKKTMLVWAAVVTGIVVSVAVVVTCFVLMVQDIIAQISEK